MLSVRFAAEFRRMPRRYRYNHDALPYDIEFTTTAWNTMQRFAQQWPWNKEAGGQLFGKIEDYRILIEEATPPRKSDKRSRAAFEIDVVGANAEIRDREKNGFSYFGDWHTHPENNAKPSGQDLRNAGRLFRNANDRSFLVLVIVGTTTSYVGLYNSKKLIALNRCR